MTCFFASSIAKLDKFTLSVLMYVICPDSYSLWATLIVLETGKDNFLDASCCKVEVVKGAGADFFNGFFTISETLNVAPFELFRNAMASSLELNSFDNLAVNSFPLEFLNIASTLNEEVET